jgi:hypothetical protein
MSDEKLLHVSCVVRQPMLWDLLRMLEAHKVGNVEVRPVAPMLALPAPGKSAKANGSRANATVQPKVRAAMAMKQKRRVPEIAREIGEKNQSVYSAVALLVTQGFVKKVGFGTYMRVKPDQMAAS